MNAGILNQALHNPVLNATDRHFARFMERLSGGENPEVALAAAIVSFQCNQGNICVHLPSVAGEEFPPALDDGAKIRCPQLKDWLKRLQSSPVVGKPGEFKPLILDNRQRLYLHRYWQYENNLVQAIQERASATSPNVNWDLVHDGFARLFPKSKSNEVDWQKVAAFAALRKNFCIISGGPGTGKTHTVALVLALLIEQAGQTKLRIKLAAPTGKAAARLQESLRQTKAEMNCDARVKAQLPEEASTIHRLLGYVPDSVEFRHNADNPLAADVVIVDEASMVGLPLMAKLVEAVPKSARLILLGDKDQLASVEAGAVLGDLCNAGFKRELSRKFADDCEKLTGEKIRADDGSEFCLQAVGECEPPLPRKRGTPNELADSIVELRKNYRFGESGRIYQLSQAINNGDAANALAALGEAESNDILTSAPSNLAGSAGVSPANSSIGDGTRRRDASAPKVASWRQLPKAAELKAQLKSIALEHFAPCFKNRRDELHESQTFRENRDSCNSSLRNAESAETILRRMEKFRILCAVRQGVYGVGAVNRLVEEILREAGLIQTDADWYAGRPVMITRNDYNLKLFNGDIGVALPDVGQTSCLSDRLEACPTRVFFRGEGGAIRAISPLRLPEHETVYAMTVHKSQGSEFENVLLILPDRESPVLTRELIYTGLTRASGSVQLWLREEIFRAAIARRVERTSGLRDALWEE